MQTLQSLKERIGTVELLQSVVRTMKTLAAVSIRQHEKAVASLTDYSKTIEMGLAIVLRDGVAETAESEISRDGFLGVVVIGSDQGLCGRFNKQIVDYSLEKLRSVEPVESRRMLVCVGTRAGMHLGESGMKVQKSLPAPVSTTGIIPAVQKILCLIEEWQRRFGLSRVILFYNHFLSGVFYRPEPESHPPRPDPSAESGRMAVAGQNHSHVYHGPSTAFYSPGPAITLHFPLQGLRGIPGQ